MRDTKLFLIALAVFTTACADTTRPGPMSGDEPVAQPTLSAESPISQVAGALARGLASPDARRQILAAMRASTQVEHQLVLGDYLRSPEGAGLLTGSTAALGTDEAQFLARVARLDEVAQLVISVPLQEHRLTWTGSPHIGLAGSWDPDVLDFPVHEPGGRRVEATEMSHLRQYDAFFYVAPRENWGTRIGRQADMPGSVIQDPDDGETAVIWTYSVGDAEPLTLDYGGFESEEELEAARDRLLSPLGLIAEGGTAGHWNDDPLVTYGPTSLTGFRSLCNTEWGREELEITVGYVNASGVWVRGSKRYYGVKDNHWYNRSAEMLPVSPKRGGADFEVSVVELDFFRDDDLGSAVVTFNNGPRIYALLTRRYDVCSKVGLTW